MCGFDGGGDFGATSGGGDFDSSVDTGFDVGGDFGVDADFGADSGGDDFSGGDSLTGGDINALYDDGALPNDVGYIQGNNEEGLDGTCGIATVAGNLNEVTGSELSENDVLEFAIENDITDNGATTQADAVELYDVLSEQTPEAGNVDIEKVSIDGNNIDDINAALQDGGTLDASIDSGVLWGEKDSFEGIDHAIGINEPVFDESGGVVGYNIRDTGKGIDFATTEELADAGLFDNEQILITDKE